MSLVIVTQDRNYFWSIKPRIYHFTW